MRFVRIPSMTPTSLALQTPRKEKEKEKAEITGLTRLARATNGMTFIF